MPAPEVTVVVPVKDRRDQLSRCLDALSRIDHPAYEVLVVDDGSADGTPELVRERMAGFPVALRLETLTGGPGVKRNLGARLAQAPVVAYTDSDCLPEPGWLRGLLAPLADPEVGVVGGRTLPEHDPERAWAVTQRVEGLSGLWEACNLAVRREALLEAGGFGEEGFGWEDTIAGLRLLRAGWQARYAPEAVVRHDVTYPGFGWHLRRQRMHEGAPAVVRAFPEVRRELLTHRVFLNGRRIRFLAACAGVLAGLRSRPALVLALPYLAVLRRQAGTPQDAARNVAIDGVTTWHLARGSARHRSPVL